MRLLGLLDTCEHPPRLGTQDLCDLLRAFQGRAVALHVAAIPPGAKPSLRLKGHADVSDARLVVGGADLTAALDGFHGLLVRISVRVVAAPTSPEPTELDAFSAWMRQCLAHAWAPELMLQRCPQTLKQAAGL